MLHELKEGGGAGTQIAREREGHGIQLERWAGSDFTVIAGPF